MSSTERFRVTDETIQEEVDAYINGNTNRRPPIGDWDTSAVTNMSGLFKNFRNFNEPLTNWDTSSVIDMSDMFFGATMFNQPLNFNTENVEDMSNMFSGATNFNQPLNFNTENVRFMTYLFSDAKKFNYPLNWDTRNVRNMRYMFLNAEDFNQPLNFNTENVLYMNSMFYGAINFNQPLNFNTRSVRNMAHMFHSATSFNGQLSFNTQNVRDMSFMFKDATSFNQPLDFNTENVQTMTHMFRNATSFNQPLNFNTVNVQNMTGMFRNATSFNQLLTFNIARLQRANRMFEGAVAFNPNNWQPVRPNYWEPIRPNNQQPARQQPTARQRTIQRPQNQNRGIAYQVHNRFAQIDLPRLFSLINNGSTTLKHYTEPIQFQEYIINVLTELVNNYHNGDESRNEERSELEYKLDLLKTKIDYIQFRDSEYDSVNAYYTILEFVKSQPIEFQDNYIYFYIKDIAEAYEQRPGDQNEANQLSCVEGIKERLLTSLAQGGTGLNNNLYTQLAEIIYPLSNEQIQTFLSDCYTSLKQELVQIPDEQMDKKKTLVYNCVMEKLRNSSYSDFAESAAIQQRIWHKVGEYEEEFQNHNLTGGRRKKGSKRSTMKKKRNPYSKKITNKYKKHIIKRKTKRNKIRKYKI